jgi:hypothetical protein
LTGSAERIIENWKKFKSERMLRRTSGKIKVAGISVCVW